MVRKLVKELIIVILTFLIIVSCNKPIEDVDFESTTKDTIKIERVVVKMANFTMIYSNDECIESKPYMDKCFITRRVDKEFISDINKYSYELLKYADGCEKQTISSIVSPYIGYNIMILIDDRLVCEWTCCGYYLEGPSPEALGHIKPLINFIETIKKHSYILSNN